MFFIEPCVNNPLTGLTILGLIAGYITARIMKVLGPWLDRHEN